MSWGFNGNVDRAHHLGGALALVLLACACTESGAGGKLGSAAPNFTLSDVSGQEVSLGDLKQNKHVLLNFWGTWCVACKSELPTLAQLDEEYKDKLAVVGISVEERSDSVANFVKKFGLKYPVLLDGDAKVMGEYGVLSVPFTVVVGPNGEIKRRARQVAVESFRKDLGVMLQ